MNSVKLFFTLTPTEISAIYLSVKVAMVAIFASLPLAIFVAWLLARKNFFGKTLVNSFVHLPLVLPPVVMGYLLLISMGKNGVIGKILWQVFGFTFGFSWTGAALASAIVAFPLLVRSIRLAFEQIDPKLEEAAKTLGASPLRTFFSITLPLSLPGVFAGIILGFARSLGEFGATITFVSNIPHQTQTLPLAMYALIETPGAEGAAARLCVIAIVIALSSLMISEYFARKAQQRLGQNDVNR